VTHQRRLKPVNMAPILRASVRRSSASTKSLMSMIAATSAADPSAMR